MHVDGKESWSSKELPHKAKEMHDKYKTIEEADDGGLELAWDDASGAALDPQSVRKAREEEIQYVRKMDLYKKVPIAECYNRTGKGTNIHKVD